MWLNGRMIAERYFGLKDEADIKRKIHALRQQCKNKNKKTDFRFKRFGVDYWYWSEDFEPASVKKTKPAEWLKPYIKGDLHHAN